mgnify:FL=1
MMQSIVFFLLAALTLGGALAVINLKNIVHSVLCLIVTFLGVAGIFLTLRADFLAAVQVLVYAGAVSILVIFALLLVNQGDGKMAETNPYSRFGYLGVAAAMLFFGFLSFSLIKTTWQTTGIAAAATSVGEIGVRLVSQYVIAFELAAVLLLVAMVAAIIIGREVKDHA